MTGDDWHRPGIGAKADHSSAHLCGYTGVSPFGPECGERATVHVAAVTSDGSLAGLPSCAAHAAAARRVPSYVSEHPHRGWCGFPGSMWDEAGQRCVLDGSGESAAAPQARADEEVMTCGTRTGPATAG